MGNTRDWISADFSPQISIPKANIIIELDLDSIEFGLNGEFVSNG